MKSKGPHGRTIPKLLDPAAGLKPKHQCKRCHAARMAFARALARVSDVIKGV